MQTDQRQFGRKLSGTFISDWLVKNWDDEKWAQELSSMREIGMEYLILAPTVLHRNDGSWYVIYPTEIEGAKESYDSIDVIETLLSNAQKYGLKVFLGLNMHERWWDFWWNSQKTLAGSEWLYEQMRLGNTVADEIYERYHSRYPDTFYGWYWVWEFWNSKIMALSAEGRSQNIRVLTNCLNINLDHLSKLDSSMPFMFSPFANMSISTYDDLYYMWKDIFKTTHFREGDIFCPQDSVGAGGTKLPELRQCYKVYKAACEQKKEIRFWANNESFVQSDWSSALLDRFVSQLEITGEFAEKNITFTFNNYYGPVNAGKGFYNAFKEYLETGTLSMEAPSSPEFVQVKKEENGVALEWDSCGDVAGYSIFRNNEPIGSVKMQRDDGKGFILPMACRFVDENGSLEDKYGVASVSYEGNYSLVCYA